MATPPSTLPLQHLHAAFLSITPRIELHARLYFRYLRCAHSKDDAIAETVALCWKCFLRLIEKGKDPLTFPVVLANFAAKHVKCGRRLCGQEKGKDVMSGLAQQRHGFAVETLPCSTRTASKEGPGFHQGQDVYEEWLRDNMQTPVAEQVAFRIDFPAWLGTLNERERCLVREMANNERTLDLSKRFKLSPARISQLRQELHTDWTRFLSDDLA
jgi:hypothetical protein